MARTSYGTKLINWERFVVNEQEGVPGDKRGRVVSYGPKELGLRQNLTSTESPEVFVQSHPELFKTGTTSRDEGYFYWGLLKVAGPEGQWTSIGIRWFYQSKVAGGRNGPGGSIVDFLLQKRGGGKDLGVRIVTPRFHTQAGPFKEATDAEQLISLLDNNIQPVDVYSQSYINDKTGRSVIIASRRAIEAQPDRSPLSRFFGVNS